MKASHPENTYVIKVFNFYFIYIYRSQNDFEFGKIFIIIPYTLATLVSNIAVIIK